MKKTLLSLAFVSTLAHSVPSVSFDKTKINKDDKVVNIDFNNPDNDAASIGVKSTFTLPAGVTIASVQGPQEKGNASSPFSCIVDTATPNGITISAFSPTLTPFPSTKAVCTITFNFADSVTSGDITSAISFEEYSNASGAVIAGASSTLSTVSVTASGGGTTDFNVTVDPSTNGSVSCTPLTGPANTSVTCTATPAAGFAVDAWTGACQSTTAGARTCNFSLTANTNVGATFRAATTYTVGVTQTAGGTVACNPTSGATGTPISCTATANTGFSVGGWNNAECSGQGATCTFTLGSANVSGVSATFNRTAPISGGVSKPVPVLGLLGLLGLLASVFGAAAMVLRRK